MDFENFFVFTDSNNETEIVPLLPEKTNYGTSEMDTSNSVDYSYNIQPLHYPVLGIILIGIVIAIRIYLRVLCCRAIANATTNNRSSTIRVYTLQSSGNEQVAPSPNLVHTSAVIIPTQEVKEDKAKNLNSSLEKYLRPQNSDDHIIDVDQRQALL